MDLEPLFERIGLAFDSDSGIYVHKKMKIPITVYYDEERGEVVLLDQTKLPYEMATWRSSDWRKIGSPGIKGMIIRGSQAIGCAAGYAMLLAAKEFRRCKREEFVRRLGEAGDWLKKIRPTAYPVAWAVDLVTEVARRGVKEGKDFDAIFSSMKEAADFFLAADLVLGWFLRQEGKKYLQNGDVIMTHCNGGSLSSSFGGHALGMIEEAYAEGMDLTVVSKETRPRCQGYKLTVWELNRAQVPVIIVMDNMVFSSFKKYGVSKVILGVDRVARDGSVANKIGSADIAHIAKMHDVPFYYATSYSTIDLSIEGNDIPIEERDIEEVVRFYRLEAEDFKRKGVISERGLSEWPPSNLLFRGERPKRGKILVYNPAFDVTPPELITMIITDIGSFKPNEIASLTEEKINAEVKFRLEQWGIKHPLA